MIIKNGIVADPASGLYEQMDILVKDGIIVKIAPALADNLSRQAQVLFEEFKKKVFKFPV